MRSPVRDTYVTMPRNISPQVKAKILEEEIKLSVQNSFRDEIIHYEDGHNNSNIEKSKRNTPQNDFVERKNNIGLMEKIQTIQENLGIDVEALLDKIYDAAERSPHNPLRKIQEKKKSKMATPEKKSEETQNFFPSEEYSKKSGIKENSFQTPQRGSKVVENERTLQNQEIINKTSSSANKRSMTEDKITRTVMMPDTNMSSNKMLVDHDKICRNMPETKETSIISNENSSLMPNNNERSSIKNTTPPKEERKSIKKSLKDDKKFSIKEDPRPDTIPKAEKEKGLMAEIKMDVQLGLDWIYTKAINDVKEMDNRKSVKREEVGMEILVKSELESLYGAVLGEVL